ncbi:MAG: HigA family addiction module antidote protein [Selenomonas sp.]|nr:HigA family addiction module antidote protein [Selenomonas sp.]
MPTVNEILKEQFMEPFGLSGYMIAKRIHVPMSRIFDILSGKRRITADTSLRLGRLFGVEDDYFLILQGRDDIEELRVTLKEELRTIREI